MIRPHAEQVARCIDAVDRLQAAGHTELEAYAIYYGESHDTHDTLGRS